MKTKNKTIFNKDSTNKQFKVTREFDAPVEKVWKAWTESRLLDQWWAPKPWKAKTKSMDFREGGKWLYAMEGPDGTNQWGRADYKTIVPQTSFTWMDAFSDEQGNINDEFPRMDWKCEFKGSPDGTAVYVDIKFASEKDMEKIIEMGFQEGFTAALGNLDELLENQ